ncbi:hypothetical protein [Sphingomonas sp.]|jgi:hypothetical protein|uniref:hypothetical protein n=1 Tax=Sphingomonas sp. TaxID=28214 RepID=UPI002E3207DB|nr:hypothetical protein [Sphingomonas sp.]HEX4694543.1 hypothetical protein [Sphingomonas sp.]
MRRFLPFVAMMPLLTGGCLGTVGKVVTAPVRVASKAVDWTTTSQSEADRNYGKKMRKAEEREGRERKAHDKACKKDPANCGPYEGYRAGNSEPKD